MRMNETPRGSGKFARAHQWKRRWLAAVTCMAALVVFCTVYALVMPATALEKKTYCGMEEHTHDDSCYESVLICGQEEGSGHVHDESCYEQELTCGKTEHTHTDECYVEPVSETSEAGSDAEVAVMPDGAQVPDDYTQQYTARDDANGFAVTVYAPEGAVPDGAKLSAELLTEDDDAYLTAEEALAENNADTQSEDSEDAESDYGFAAMDIHFEDANGNKVEPDGDVYVVIDAAGLLPEGADTESITVQHHVEQDNGDVTVETVADTADETDGVVVAQDDEENENSGVQAAFEVKSFSTFTITWETTGENRSVSPAYKKELTTVDTVDSTAEGVHMYMFDYNGPAFSGGAYNPGDVKEGLATTTVNANGWPSLTGDNGTTRGTSFSNFFGNSVSAYDVESSSAVNNLFLKSYYDVDGTFYYSSFENFATLKNDNDNKFTVYEQLGSSNNLTGEKNYFYQRGNFFPYNTLNINNVINHNLYSDTGEKLSQDDERYNEDIYGFNEPNNYYFGMYVWADFYQPENGQVENNAGTSSRDMVFEFTGDDDMWVYIDGVLVLDLGGIHDAQSGSINFATGEVRWTDTKTGQDPAWEQNDLKSIFEKADQENTTNWDGNTFADGSNHRIQIFYMERGAGASNLKISFNLKTIPDGQLAVTKEVENYYAPQLENIEYTMQVMVNGEPYANQDYTFYEQSGGGTTDENGCFTLKYGQTAVFPDLTVNDVVTVKEIGSSDTEEGSSISSNYDIDYTITDGSGNTTGDAGTDGTATATMPGYGSIRVTVTNTATYTRPLKLVKNFSGTAGNVPPDDFEATYTLYEVKTGEDDTEIGSIKYSDMTNGEYIFWLDVDKTYKIIETFEDGDNDGSTTDLFWSGSVTKDTDKVTSDGLVTLVNGDATKGPGIETITITNNYGVRTIDINVKKVDSSSPQVTLGNAQFLLYRTESDTTEYYSYNAETNTVSWGDQESADILTSSSEPGDSHGMFVIHSLPNGTYYLVENTPPAGYELLSGPITITISNGNISASYGGNNIYDSETETVIVPNTAGAVLPSTGGPGTTYVTIGGLLLMAAAVGGGYGLRRRRGREGR